MNFRGIKKFADEAKDYYKNMNTVVLICTILLVIIGLIGVYSATSDANKTLFYKQLICYISGFAIMMIFANMNYNILISVSNWLYWIFMVLLSVVLVFGHTSLGATRWLKIGGFQFQPSEFMKLIVALAVIRFILINAGKAFSIKNLALLLLMVAVPMALILKQPDLGTAVLLVPMTLAVLFMGNIPLKKFVIILLVGLSLLPISFFMLKDYQRERISTFMNPQIDPLGAGYNVIQSQIAVGSGQLLGKGWGQGTQSQLDFIPIKYTDFIFAVLAEEFGFWGSAIVILVYFFLVMEALKIVKICRFNGGKMLGAAITTALFMQFAINIGMNMGLMPVTGVTLPLLSYGGTSVIVTMIAIGILQNIFREYMKAEE
jgi:rod shape determining protein RodA